MANVWPLKRAHLEEVKTATRRRYLVSVDFDLTAVSPQWRELESTGGLTPFQTQAWLLSWYQIVAPALNIFPIFVTVRDRASGRPMMLLPLCLKRKLGVARITFPDCGLSDYNAPLLSPGFQPSEAEFEELWNDISRALPRADLISFEKMPEFVAERPNPMVRLSSTKCMRLRAWGFELPNTRSAYDKSLRTNIRTELRRRRRKLEGEGPVRFVRAQSEAQGREIFEMLRRQQKARFTQLGRPNILDSALYLRFYKSVIFDSWNKRFSLLSALLVHDQVVATAFALNHQHHYLLLMHSFEPGHWHTKSPGILLLDNTITNQIESGGTYFDLTVGNEVYKRKFGVTGHLLHSRIQGLSAIGWAFALISHARKIAGNQIRRLPERYLPERLKS